MGIRYDRYANALTAAAVYNVNRGSSDDPLIAAFDFVRDEQSALRRERRNEAKRHISRTIGSLPFSTTRDRYLVVRRRVIGDLTKSGYTNAEELFDSVWPHLKPTQEEIDTHE